MVTVSVAAVDLGASSGRVVYAEIGPGMLGLDTVARFANDPVGLPDGLHWNLLGLFAQVLSGLRSASARGPLASIGIDSWAVDYGLLRSGSLLGVPFHYRDERSAAGVQRVHARVLPDDLYARNGLQFLPFNTVYQLAADPLVAAADRLLLVPDLLGYWLTGNAASERTNASTTGLLHAATREWDDDLITRLSLPRDVFTGLVDPGTPLGSTRDLGFGHIGVVAVGSHDTASAVVGTPMVDDGAAYVSCGTWGLVGVELAQPVLSDAARAANFTNEGGVDGRVRFLTNVMGTWLISETLRTWEREGDEADLVTLLGQAATVTGPVPVFDVQDARFLAPGDMPTRISSWFHEHDQPAPVDKPVVLRSIVESLGQAFADALETAALLSGRRIDTVHLVGGGSQNQLLCQAVADRSGRVVQAGPVEATALGNVLVQGRAAGAVTGDLESLRALVAATQELRTFTPRVGRDRMGP